MWLFKIPNIFFMILMSFNILETLLKINVLRYIKFIINLERIISIVNIYVLNKE